MFLLGFAGIAAALNLKIQVCTGSSCSKCDPLSPFKNIASLDIVTVDCLDQCQHGPTARVLVDDAPALFGSMDTAERSTRTFRNVSSDDRARHVVDCALRLRGSLAAPRRINFYDAYADDELRQLLDVHKLVHKDRPPKPIDNPADILDLHSVVKALVEKKSPDAA